jgi:D-alanine-D-alanine ligase
MASDRLLVALAYSADIEFAPDDEPWLEASCGLDSVEAVEAACLEAGYDVRRVVVDKDLLAAGETLARERPDVVFAMVESVDNDARLEAAFPYLLDSLGLPYTGAPALALALALHKPIARSVLGAAGVPVPGGIVLEDEHARLDGRLRYPLIVKPAREDGSMGVSSASVVPDERTALERARVVRAKFRQPAIVEEFVDGREFNVSLIGPTDDPQVLPLREIDFRLPPELPRVLTYEAKWVTESVEYGGTMPIAAEALEPEVMERIRAIGRDAYRAIGLRDYGRVDVRLHPTDGPFVIDVNPNPELLPGTMGIAGAALDAGMSFVDLVALILKQAVARGSKGG